MNGIEATQNKTAELALKATPQILVIARLLWALVPGDPYGYYILLRWVCCGVFAYFAVQAFNDQCQGWVWVLGVTAGIYSPIVPVHLTREIWVVVNVVTIGIALGSVFRITSNATCESARR